MVLSDFFEDDEVLNGVKDLLKETYKITDHEATSIIMKSRDKADGFLDDYSPYVNYINDLRSCLEATLEAHFQQVDQENELQARMKNDAAVWLTFECIRRFCKKSLLTL
ncbi:hypothetical protein [Paenibacillus sp. FSL H7-0331]|uniref:hypothetical protein n=1 Tax=Paenibacillus sp. FSL H7-0331 TaxID=1920421 RepID=UPI00096E1A3B|nr:hypothetical protein [Paenibacillus sp. FSL H7-0331]OMF18420.1 hypothetical protein BK127_11675 [Paenibacillus sp. FSL H7-0331]